MKLLITGVAGFIGSHVAKKFLSSNHTVIGIDNLNEYYDVKLKHDRLKSLLPYKNFTFNRIDFSNSLEVQSLFNKNKFDAIIHLGAQAGVRYSLSHPEQYVSSNILGSINLLEQIKDSPIPFIYASSSSVYGENSEVPFVESSDTDHPVSIYAASKKSLEVFAHSYASLYGIPAIGLRFFTVYGPWGRPDMAPILFAKSIVERRKLRVFNNGEMYRDFTYIDDIGESISRLLKNILNEVKDFCFKNQIFNIGNGNPVHLMDFIRCLETSLNGEANLEFFSMQQGDVSRTWADSSKLKEVTGFSPSTTLEEGVKHFSNWFHSYYGMKGN